MGLNNDEIALNVKVQIYIINSSITKLFRKKTTFLQVTFPKQFEEFSVSFLEH
jgi:hypothetical protein